jgi:hypothetical protein
VFTLAFALVASASAKVPEFNLQFGNRIKQSGYTPFENKILLKVIPEKRIAIYGNREDVLIISETPFPENQSRYLVEVNKNGKINIIWFHDPSMLGNIPLQMPKNVVRSRYDHAIINLELPFKIKQDGRKFVYCNHRLEITLAYKGDKSWIEELRRSKRGFK